MSDNNNTLEATMRAAGWLPISEAPLDPAIVVDLTFEGKDVCFEGMRRVNTEGRSDKFESIDADEVFTIKNPTHFRFALCSF